MLVLRSRRHAHSLRSLAALLAAWLACAEAAWSAAQKEPANVLTFPTAGFRTIAPAGWQRQEKDRSQLVARWYSPDSTTRKQTALIAIEAGWPRPGPRTLEEHAESLAKDWGGKVDPQPTTLGGTKALRVRAPSGKALRPVEAIICVHGGYQYMVLGGVVAGHDCAAEIEAIRKNWEWVPIELPARHLGFRPEPMVALGGMLSLNLPTLMHAYPTEHPERVLDLGLYNLRRNDGDFFAYVQVAPKDPDISLREAAGRFGEMVAKEMNADPLPQWQERKGQPQRLVSQTLLMDNPKDPGRVHVRWAMVAVDARRILLINFMLNAATEEERKAYEPVVDRIVDSIALRKGAATAPATRPATPAPAK